MTGNTTPESVEFDPQWYALFGGDPKEQRRAMLEEQREAEERLEQERHDREFALSLERGDQSLYTPADPSMEDQTFVDSHGRCSRTDPPVSSFTADLLSSSPFVDQEDPFAHASLPSKAENRCQPGSDYDTIKEESDPRNYQWPQSQKPSQDFIDLESEEFEHLCSPPAGNSDPVEIDQKTWDHSQQPQVSNGMVNPRGWDYASQSIANVARGVYNSAYNLVDQQINSYGTAPFVFDSGTSVYSTDPVPIVDLEDDLTFGNSAYQAFERHGFSTHDPVNQRLLEQYRERYNYVTHDPTRTAAEITSLLEHIRPDEELPPEDREGTPDAMKYPLMEHQKLGLAWMKKMEESRHHRGAILADDMGLGKTITALALMTSNKSNDLGCKTNLIIAPVALLKQWEREIQSKLKPGREHSLKTFILHGANRSAGWEKLKHYDVVLTTFGTIANELKRAEAIATKKKANPNWQPTAKDDHLPLLGDQCLWYRIIIDEAQCIKNKNTKAAIGACCLRAKTRWCMTGTPMMNNVQELYSLIKFLDIEPYCQQENFNRDFTKPLTKATSEEGKQKAMRKLQTLLKAILLRRTKKSQIDGKPILNLPERTTVAEEAIFSDDEKDFYQGTLSIIANLAPRTYQGDIY